MFRLPDRLTPESFLAEHWQKCPLYMPQALQRLRPSITRNELAWLATLDDVESRIIFVERQGGSIRYQAETGPFETEFLVNLPKRDWTLLVHDVEKHLPRLRTLLDEAPFIPDWRIDDLMVSFAAPGGSVGPHKDNYDVFLCQGIGTRDWYVTTEPVAQNADASGELSLLQEFSGERMDTREGDVLYLPPGVAHWGVAKRACMTYSIGMRAPQTSDIAYLLNRGIPSGDPFYEDPDLGLDEAVRGYISEKAAQRACQLMNLGTSHLAEASRALGQYATRTKDWLTAERLTGEDTMAQLKRFRDGRRLRLHGMCKIAFDEQNFYVNGHHYQLPKDCKPMLASLCAQRYCRQREAPGAEFLAVLRWMLEHGAFEGPDGR